MNKRIKEFLRKENIFAVVGVSRDKKKYGYKVYKNLKEAGYKVYPINPNASEIEGEKCYSSLSELPEKPDVVNLVVQPKITEEIGGNAKNWELKKVWMQPGAESKEAIKFCLQNSIEVVYNVCVMLERKKFR